MKPIATRIAGVSLAVLTQADPCGCVIARTILTAHFPIDTSAFQTATQGRRYQKVIEAQACIALPPKALVVPERLHRAIRMQAPECIDPALCDKFLEGLAQLGLKQNVLRPRSRPVDIKVRRHDIEVTGHDDGHLLSD